ncbi:MAG: cupin [Planctomycetes bacterium]|nr:cupin [Planctomycetota bacterium]
MTAMSEERLTEAARFHDYRYASNPIADGTLRGVPAATWGAELHELGPTRILPLDSSATLGVVGPSTTPGLCVNFVHVRPSEAIATEAAATTHLFFAMRGAGATRLADGTDFAWHSGDLFILPAGGPAVHDAAEDAALYWVHDEPLLRYLGVVPRQARFSPTVYRRAAIHRALDAVVHDPSSASANRLSVLLGNRLFPQTMTITHVLWAMFGLLPVGAVQAPHRHQSVAVDLVVDCKPGCYTMVGRTLDAEGRVASGQRFDWHPHAVFVTPPGLWHSHHNESGHPAHILPIQDAGLHTYLRTLDIRFARANHGGGSDLVERAG